ncbi:DNA gyrase subunit A [Candidatus Woesearchaeota archaeon]|nr:DNA gyrase subunit A [Candidatus Woesearchaeota archaeon]
MRASYLDYAMSVIIGRALPDVRDGLKPVHRRILYAMNDMGIKHNTPFKKCARIVGEVLGKYHPHGDTAVYDSLVRMAQDFSLRYPLIKGQGNFGSVDGDNAAAMRYTEAKLARISDEMLTDIEKETVPFVENFDGSLKEPIVLPSKLPNLLINGSSGIAVGMATNIPPHNVKEVCKAVVKIIDNPEVDIKDLLEVVRGPDFPTGGIICGRNGITEAYLYGRGSIDVKGKIEVEDRKDRQNLIITEIPYQVNKSQLIEQMAEGVNNKVIEGVSDIRDESDRNGMRIVLELKRGANNEVVKNQLLKHTRLQTSFGAIMIALVDNQPKTMNLKTILVHFLNHRRIVVRKKTEYDLRKAEEKAHLLEGLLIALAHLDPVIALIKSSKDPVLAKKGLMDRYKLTEVQSQAILDMRLQRLTGLEQQKIRDEHKSLVELIRKLKSILSDEKEILSIIKGEMHDLSEKYGDERRTEIDESAGDALDFEDLIKPEDCVITVSQEGYVKRQSLDVYKTQKRGGRGVIGATTKEEDVIEHLFVANTHDYVLVFTDKGRVHWLKGYQFPEAARQSKGRPIINLIRVEAGEKVQAIIPVKEFSDKEYLCFATRKGLIKKTLLSEYGNPRQGGIIAINLNDGDAVIEVVKTGGGEQIFMASKNGQAVKFSEEDVRSVGRASQGVRGIRLDGKDEVIGMIIAKDDKAVLTVTSNGYGKRSSFEEYRFITRGGKGVRNIICSERNGPVVSVRSVNDEDEVMLVSKNGIMIRVPAANISVIGRNTQGVRIMKLEPNDKVVAVAKVEGNGSGPEQDILPQASSGKPNEHDDQGEDSDDGDQDD